MIINDIYAFPCGHHPDKISADQPGMTLRDVFAAAALTGITASQACSEANPTFEDVARKAFAQADAMLVQREKPPLNPPPNAHRNPN